MLRIPRRRLALLALLSLPAAACESSTDPMKVVPELVGTWTAVVPDEPFPLTTLSGVYQVRLRWAWTFYVDGEYERRETYVTEKEGSDTNVETGTWSAGSGEIRFVRLTSTRVAASSRPWGVRIVADSAARRIHRMSYEISQGTLRLFGPCNDEVSCAGIPVLTRAP